MPAATGDRILKISRRTPGPNPSPASPPSVRPIPDKRKQTLRGLERLRFRVESLPRLESRLESSNSSGWRGRLGAARAPRGGGDSGQGRWQSQAAPYR